MSNGWDQKLKVSNEKRNVKKFYSQSFEKKSFRRIKLNREIKIIKYVSTYHNMNTTKFNNRMKYLLIS